MEDFVLGISALVLLLLIALTIKHVFRKKL
jgi:hypothetical protein